MVMNMNLPNDEGEAQVGLPLSGIDVHGSPVGPGCIHEIPAACEKVAERGVGTGVFRQ